jgi:hypothetical protein
MRSKNKFLLALATLFVATVFLACNNKSEEEKLDDNVAQNVAIAFAQASCKGDFKKAQSLLLPDSVNIDDYNNFSQHFNTRPPADKEGLKQASLQNWRSSTVVLDSVYLYTYLNSYTKKENVLKLVKFEKKWRVDFSYVANGNLH